MSGVGTGSSDRSPLAALSERARASRVAENIAAAERLRACYALYRECLRTEDPGADADPRPGYAVVDPFDVCANLLVAEFAVSCGRAERMISLAVDLTERYPALLAALGEGRLDLQAVELLARQMRTVDPAVLAEVQQEVVDDLLASLEAGERPTAGAVRDRVDDVIRRFDADGIRRRREDASRDRGVTFHKDGDGMSTMRATLTSGEAAVLSERLDAIAAALTRSTEHEDLDRHSPAERRADALMALACGQVPGSDSGPVVLRPRVTVVGTPDGTEPEVRFPRTGESSIRALLDVLASSDGSSLERVDPNPGAADDPDRAHTYRPSAALARAVVLRDGTCRHPGCSRAAEYGDIDHLVPFNAADPARGGPTVERNNLVFCRRHHRFKTFSDWRYQMSPDGTLVVETPDGKRIVTTPSGPLARWRRRAADGTPVPAGTSEPTESEPAEPTEPAEPEPTYFHRRAQRARAERAAVSRDRGRTAEDRAAERARHRAARLDRAWVVPDHVSRVELALAELLDAPPF